MLPAVTTIVSQVRPRRVLQAGALPCTLPYHCCACRRERAAINEFCSATGSPTLLVTYQVPEEQNAEGEWVKRGSAPVLHMSKTLHQRVTGAACYFVRLASKSITEKTIADDVTTGVMRGNVLNNLRMLINDLYGPMLRKQEKWGRLGSDLQTELLKRVGQFGATLAEAAESLAGGVELAKPEPKYMGTPLTLTGFKEAADKPEVVQDFATYLRLWISKACFRTSCHQGIVYCQQ